MPSGVGSACLMRSPTRWPPILPPTSMRRLPMACRPRRCWAPPPLTRVGFAASWASERGVVPVAPVAVSDRAPAPSRARLVVAALAIVAALALFVAALALVFGGHGGESVVAHPDSILPGPGPTDPGPHHAALLGRRPVHRRARHRRDRRRARNARLVVLAALAVANARLTLAATCSSGADDADLALEAEDARRAPVSRCRRPPNAAGCSTQRAASARRTWPWATSATSPSTAQRPRR